MPDKRTIITIAGILFIAGFVSLFASGSPDGLEHTAGSLGLAAPERSWWQGLIPDYAVPGLGSSPLATSLAGLIGALLVYGLFAGAARRITKNFSSRLPVDKA
ncbi:hypothetical protein AUK40_03775 [Candidatus Wirthbacteria bacterium CG2_30_54_11]|uniref:PDGLE domain-containing protein n=1 Tax=Candidatus Wirthbacteria bacterium CG2_30_54_11 TaxID=1817892 RepID=A0A1J5IY00_9BACT|nr:MAG: hypothetical protein AUK40_03775 [Candidatus Wirthbacteria bacterium CG2_30_54_11]